MIQRVMDAYVKFDINYVIENVFLIIIIVPEHYEIEVYIKMIQNSVLAKKVIL
jgi:hypothetical protein